MGQLDQREQRQLRLALDVDDVVEVDLPVWYMTLTQHISGRWRRELGVVLAALILGVVLGAALALMLDR